MYSARYRDYLTSLTGACVVAFGLGATLADQVGALALPAIVIGAVLHAWGMYRTHRRPTPQG